jgi:hypothetical protein
MIFNATDLVHAENAEGMPVIGWHSIVTTGNVDSTTEDASFPATNVASPDTYTKWKGGVNTAGIEFLTVTVTSLEEMDYLAIARHNFGTEQYTLAVEINTGGSPDWVPITFFDTTSPGATTVITLDDDDPIVFRFDPQVLTGIRLKITTSGESANVPELAVLYVGKLLVMERSIDVGQDHVPMIFGRRTNAVNSMSENGQFLGRIVLSEHRESKAQFKWFTDDFYRDDIDEFLEAAQETPFFFAWSPEEYPAEVSYAWLTNNAEPMVDPATRRVHLDLEMKGIA